MESADSFLSGFPVVITLPVLWGDLDAFGHLNNIVYLRWCETARVDYLTQVGFWPALPPDSVAPILAAISCNYRRPVTYPDTVLVGARVTRIGNSSFRMEHRIVSRSQNAVVAEADSTIVALDYSRNRAVPLPEASRTAMEKTEGRPLGRNLPAGQISD